MWFGHWSTINTISGCSSDGRARGLGPRGRWFETSHSDQISTVVLIRNYRAYLFAENRSSKGHFPLYVLSIKFHRAVQEAPQCSSCTAFSFSSNLRWNFWRLKSFSVRSNSFIVQGESFGVNFLYGLPVINFSRTALDIQNVPERRTKLSPLLKMIINIPPAAEQSSAAGSSALFGNLQRFELHH